MAAARDARTRQVVRFLTRKIVPSVLLGLLVLILWSCQPRPAPPTVKITDYDLGRQSAFNQPEFYPQPQNLNTQRYQPVADWLGRLLLPPSDSSAAADWVWFEVLHAPPGLEKLVGQKLRLEWHPQASFTQALPLLTRDVNFTAAAQASTAQGNLHPSRLNGRQRVGPLQSLAGAHPVDDVLVALEGGVLVNQATNQVTLQIRQAPLQVSGQFYGLVQFLGPATAPEALPLACPGPDPCANQHYRIRHYNRQSGQFDGATEIVLFPQVAAGSNGLFTSTPRQIEGAAAGRLGWYIYGAQNRQGEFVVQAVMPRSLVQIKPQQTYQGLNRGLNYLKQKQWQQMEAAKGQLTSVSLLPQSQPADASTGERNGPGDWQLGEQALVLHIFGGIGGRKAEPNPIPGTVTGHFAYGWATVKREPLADELQFDLRYEQIYAHNPNGIIAGSQNWPAYMGDLQRGWLGLRPVSDVLVRFAPLLEDYQFPGQFLAQFPEPSSELVFSPRQELQQQLQIMAARYRTGDGTGAALVNPAQSCVQDSNQAVFITIERLEAQVKAHPEIQSWLQTHPTDPQALRFQQLLELRQSLERQLSPLRLVRSDWRENAEILSGIAPAQPLGQKTDLWSQLLSWRTAVPRVAHDLLSTTFLNQGARLWVLRTNQVGGWDPAVLPLAPTQLLEGTPIPYLCSRTIEALTARPTLRDWGLVGLALLGYGLVAVPWGWRQQFLYWRPLPTFRQHLGLALQTFFAPALLEEHVFRVLLLPHTSEAVEPGVWWGWGLLSLGLFLVYHPLNALLFYPPGRPLFWQPPFLLLAASLGGVCSLVYALSGSLWGITCIHWLVVYVWLAYLGGQQQLTQRFDQNSGFIPPQASGF